MQRKRMNYDTFMEMIRQRSLGVSARQICKNIGIGRGLIERWWHKSEDEFLSVREQKISNLERYREFIVNLLSIYPQIRATNVYFKIKESCLPNKQFAFENLPKVTVWQIEKLLEFEWLNHSDNIFLTLKITVKQT